MDAPFCKVCSQAWPSADVKIAMPLSKSCNENSPPVATGAHKSARGDGKDTVLSSQSFAAGGNQWLDSASIAQSRAFFVQLAEKLVAKGAVEFPGPLVWKAVEEPSPAQSLSTRDIASKAGKAHRDALNAEEKAKSARSRQFHHVSFCQSKLEEARNRLIECEESVTFTTSEVVRTLAEMDEANAAEQKEIAEKEPAAKLGSSYDDQEPTEARAKRFRGAKVIGMAPFEKQAWDEFQEFV